ncbi:helix-turn-helix domain-containing protein [Limimaricola sp.]|uniref:helix-turn-helix domain-containing protein n=1 Tax=Limimaricola sp. TaxID=2211665 RepID=UPI0040581753
MTDSQIVYYTPGRADAAHPYRILAAGRSHVGPGDAVETTRYDHHTLILCLSGQGRLVARGQETGLGPGAVAWLDTGQEYAHSCAPGRDGWSYLWFAMTGYGLDQLFARLWREGGPVRRPARPLPALFESAIAALRHPDRRTGARATAIAAGAIEAMFEADRPETGADTGPAEALRRCQRQVREGLAQRWSVAEMAAIAAMSPSHFHKRFRETAGLAPMEWLRLERITAAKYLLSGSDLRIAEIGRRCGYGDPYHFSRDFARATGLPPSGFRRAGHGPGSAQP